MRTKSTIFLFFVIIQLWIVFWHIFILTPHASPLAVLGKESWLILYILVGIVGMSIKLITKIRYDWVVYLSSCITILYGIFILIIHSPHYHNIGTLPIAIKLRDINPITYYEDLAKYPPPVSSIYVVVCYNIVTSLLAYFRSKKQFSK